MDDVQRLNSEDLKAQRETMKSITKLLCECDSLAGDDSNPIINDIYSSFVTLFSQIRQEKQSSSLNEGLLISVYQKFFNSFRGYLSGIYRSG